MIDSETLRKRVFACLAEQRALVERLLTQKEQLQGSVFVRFMECRKEGCACAEGDRHGPYYVFSRRSGGRGAYAYLEETDVPAARDMVARSRDFKKGLQRLQKVNTELVELLRRYQEATTRKGIRRLGLPAQAGR